MSSYNRVILLGNLTRDVELRYTNNNKAVTDIGLAINDRVKRGDQWTDEATFVDITLFGRNAEVAAEYLSKGSSCLIEGRLKLDQWEQDGQRRSKLKVIGDKLQLLGGKQERSKPEPQGVSGQQQKVARQNAPDADAIPW